MHRMNCRGGSIAATDNMPNRWKIRAGAALIVLAGLFAWQNSFSGVFVFDDEPAIFANLTIRHLRSLPAILSPPSDGSPVTGRPLVNLTLAINYALSGTRIWSYHAVNLLIHVLAGLMLFGIVRRTLLLPSCRSLLLSARSVPVERGPRTPPPSAGEAASGLSAGALAAAGDAAPQSHAASLAFAISLLWTVHPLQTGSVTYIAQRAESLMGLFYLLTLYCFIRGTESGRPFGGSLLADDGQYPSSGIVCEQAPTSADGKSPRAWSWFLLAVLACLLGMAAKEVMVSAPLVVLLYDRTFVAGSFREACRRRGRVYLGLAATWLLLGFLVIGAGNRGGSAGFGLSVTPWSYALTQGDAILRYLGLSFWPHPLIIDYGPAVVHSLTGYWWQAIAVLILLGGTIWAVMHRPRSGFLGACFFLILAPSSSVVPVATEVMAEHRMYLPLAAVIAGAVLGLRLLLQKLPDLGLVALRLRGLLLRGPAVLLLAVAFPLGWLTMRRNVDYRSEIALWTDAVTKRPSNPRAHGNLGSAWLQAGSPATALAEEQEALRLDPGMASAAFYAGEASRALGHDTDALRYYGVTVNIEPGHTMAQVSLGNLLVRLGRPAEACRHYEAVLQKLPDFAPAHYNLAMAMLQMGQSEEAIAEFQTVLRLQPATAEVCYNLGAVLLQLGRLSEAQTQFEHTLKLDPENPAANNNLGNILVQRDRPAEAIDHYHAALKSDPANVGTHCNLGAALIELGRVAEAKIQFETALRLQPDLAPAKDALLRLQNGQ